MKAGEQREGNGRSLGLPLRCSSVTGPCGPAPSSRLVAGPNLWPRHPRLFMRWLLRVSGVGSEPAVGQFRRSQSDIASRSAAGTGFGRIELFETNSVAPRSPASGRLKFPKWQGS